MIKIKQLTGGLYGRFSFITLVAVYVLILVGGIVRTTGSGMGCPDWPKCFDQWVPPSSVDQLPANYRETYADYRAGKNEKFARYLRLFGMDKTADKLLSDKSVLKEKHFNKYNTWIEYLNRLVGMLIGIFILLTFVFSFRYFKTDRKIFYVSLATLVLVILQGWIGSIVVSTNLVPWMVTVHMLLAIGIVFLLVYLVHRSRSDWSVGKAMAKHKRNLMVLVIVAMAAVIIQIFLGTQVREGIDMAASQMGDQARNQWIGTLGTGFIVHRSFSWIIVLVNGLLFYLLWKQDVKRRLMGVIVLLIIFSVLTGIIMAYLGIPAAIQPMHLLSGTLIIGLLFSLFLQLRKLRSV